MDFLEPLLKRFMVGLYWIPGGDGDCLRDCGAEKGNLIPWVVQTYGEESWVVVIVVGVTSLCFSRCLGCYNGL
jgi:hypothetical protein